MKYVILIGKVVFTGIWVFLIGALFFASSKGQVALFSLLLMILSVLHVLQVFIFYSAFHQPLKDKGLAVGGKDYVAIFFFWCHRLADGIAKTQSIGQSRQGLKPQIRHPLFAGNGTHFPHSFFVDITHFFKKIYHGLLNINFVGHQRVLLDFNCPHACVLNFRQLTKLKIVRDRTLGYFRNI